MKKLLIVVGIVSAGMLTTQAKEVVNIHENTFVLADTTQQDSVKRTKVEINELPEAVKTTLQSEHYQGWAVISAFFVEQKDVNPFYEITLKKDDEEELKIVKLTVEGKVIE